MNDIVHSHQFMNKSFCIQEGCHLISFKLTGSKHFFPVGIFVIKERVIVIQSYFI